MQQVSEQLARATVYLLMDELVRYPASEQPYHLARIVRDKRFGFPVHLLQVKELDLDDDQRRRVVEGDTVMALGKDGDSIRIFAGILDTPWVLELGPLFQMNPYPPQLLLLLGALCLSFIGLITYLLVRRLEQRLRSLEAAATRIARGSLDTRVEVRGGDSVGRLGAAFNHMAEHIHRLLTVQREMVRAVSHELRTPVARLRFGLEMIETAETDGARLKYLEGMDNDIQDLDKLVDEMLTYARLEQGSPPLTYQRLELGVLVRQVVEEIARCVARCWSVARRARWCLRAGQLDRGRAALPASGLAEPADQCAAACRSSGQDQLPGQPGALPGGCRGRRAGSAGGAMGAALYAIPTPGR